MAYNPYNAINSIYNLKGQYDEADRAGNENQKNAIAQQAQQYYQQLRDNGYSEVADSLSNSNYKQAEVTKKAYEALGKTATRPYLHSLGEAYGLSKNAVDNLISYNDITNEITFGGKNIGKADVVVDGTSYWNSTDTLDKAFNDYIQRSGTTKTDRQLSSENSMGVKSKTDDLYSTQKSNRETMMGKYDKLEDYNYNYNPYESEIGKSIMSDYQWKGAQASNNAAASGSASNGGNIDSFSAANAARQQLAFTNAGKAAVLADFNQRVTNAKDILNNMGVYLQNQDAGMQNTITLQQNEAQRLFENDETAKNNAVSRDSVISSDTGYNTISQLKATSGLWNSDGSLANRNMDYMAQMNKLEAQYNSTSDENTKRTILNQLRMLEMARNQKISEDGSSETPTFKYQTLTENAEMRTNAADRESAERVANGENETNLNAINAQIYGDLALQESKNASDERIAAIQAQTEKDIAAYEAQQAKKSNNSTGSEDSNPDWLDGSSSGSSSDNEPMSKDQVEQWVTKLNNEVHNKYGNKYNAVDTTTNGYKVGATGADYIIIRVMDSDDLTNEQKMYLLNKKFGISNNTIQDAIRDPHYN